MNYLKEIRKRRKKLTKEQFLKELKIYIETLDWDEFKEGMEGRLEIGDIKFGRKSFEKTQDQLYQEMKEELQDWGNYREMFVEAGK